MYAGHEGGAYAKNSFGNMYALMRDYFFIYVFPLYLFCA